jgi:hypothetical protein
VTQGIRGGRARGALRAGRATAAERMIDTPGRMPGLRRVRVTGPVAVALTVVMAACGDDGGSSTSTAVGAQGSQVEVADLADGAAAGGADSHPLDVERLQVTAAHEAAMEARIESSAAPVPDPDSPAVADTHVDPLLSRWQDRLGGMAAQGLAIRYPEDSQLEIVAVMDITFSWSDGSAAAAAEDGEVGDTATLIACILDDGETYNVATGEVTAGGSLVTVHEEATLRKIDGQWRLADRTATEREGRTGCAADNAGEGAGEIDVEVDLEVDLDLEGDESGGGPE